MKKQKRLVEALLKKFKRASLEKDVHEFAGSTGAEDIRRVKQSSKKGR